MEIDLNALQNAAWLAGSKEWKDNGRLIYKFRKYGNDPSGNDLIWRYADNGGADERYIAYICAANPAVVMELLKRLEASETCANNFERFFEHLHEVAKALGLPSNADVTTQTLPAVLALIEQVRNVDKLLSIIGAAYQIAGCHDSPEHVLDVLCDPEAATLRASSDDHCRYIHSERSAD